MKVSVIVPVYNSSMYLRDCLDSLVNQSLEDIEIIVVDDDSKDNSFQIMMEYRDNYPDKIKVIKNDKNMGQGAARNRGIELASGDYIGFLDSDDYVNSSMYETMYEAAKKNNNPEVIVTGLIFTKNSSYLENGFNSLRRGEGKLYSVLTNPEIILDQSPSVCNKLFRKDTIKGKGFLENRMWEDVSFTFAKLFDANHILCFNNPDYFYRRGDNGVSSKGYDVNENFLDIFTVTDQLEKETKEANRFETFEDKIKFIQISACLQRASEVMEWNVPFDVKRKICKQVISIMTKKYGDWRKIPVENLSSRVGFMELERIREITDEVDNYTVDDLSNTLDESLNKRRK